MTDFPGSLVAIVTLGVSVMLTLRWAIQSSTRGTCDAELDAILLLEPFHVLVVDERSSGQMYID